MSIRQTSSAISAPFRRCTMMVGQGSNMHLDCMAASVICMQLGTQPQADEHTISLKNHPYCMHALLRLHLYLDRALSGLKELGDGHARTADTHSGSLCGHVGRTVIPAGELTCSRCRVRGTFSCTFSRVESSHHGSHKGICMTDRHPRMGACCMGCQPTCKQTALPAGQVLRPS